MSSGSRTFDTVDYSDQGEALNDLRNGKLNGVLSIPPDFSRRVLAKERAACRAHRRQHRHVRVGDDGGRRRRTGRRVECSAVDVSRVAGRDVARRRRGLPVRPLHPVPAAGIDRDVDLHDGHDRRRHHLHRRQGARAARGLSRDADHARRAHRGIQPVRDDQGGPCRNRPHDARVADRRHSGSRSSRCGCCGCRSSSS